MNEIRVPQEIDRESALALESDVRRAIAHARGPIVLRGSAEVFCRGVSLSAIAGVDDPRPFVEAVGAALHDLLQSPLPTIAIVEGLAVGGGVGLLAACDRVIATESAAFALPELSYGLVPLLIAPSLRRRLGPQAFLWLALSGASQSAAQALEIGLVDEVVSVAALPGRLAATKRLLGRVDGAALACVRGHLLPPETLKAEIARAVDATIARLVDSEVRARIATYVHEGVPPWEGRA